MIYKYTEESSLRSPDEIRKELAYRGISISEWARDMGFSPGLVHQVLAGRLKCVRGQAHKVAVVLGLKSGSIEGIDDFTVSIRDKEVGDDITN